MKMRQNVTIQSRAGKYQKCGMKQLGGRDHHELESRGFLIPGLNWEVKAGQTLTK